MTDGSLEGNKEKKGRETCRRGLEKWWSCTKDEKSDLTPDPRCPPKNDQKLVKDVLCSEWTKSVLCRGDEGSNL